MLTQPLCCLAERGEEVTVQQVALVLHLQLWEQSIQIHRWIFGAAAMCRWGEAVVVILMLYPCSLHQGGDREAEIKGAHPEAPKWREDGAGEGRSGQTGHHQEAEGGGCQEERSPDERCGDYSSNMTTNPLFCDGTPNKFKLHQCHFYHFLYIVKHISKTV